MYALIILIQFFFVKMLARRFKRNLERIYIFLMLFPDCSAIERIQMDARLRNRVFGYCLNHVNYSKR